MGGAVSIDSRTGLGCSVELRIPVSLIASHALLVRVADRTLAVSERGVSQVLHASAGTLEIDRGAVSLRIDETLYPLEAIYAAAYVFIDRCYVFLDKPAEHRVRVTLSSKKARGLR